MPPSEPDSKVLFRIDNEDGSSDVETLWATSLGPDRFRIENSPFYAYSVSWLDVVLAPFGLVSNFEAYTREETKPHVAEILADVPGVACNDGDGCASQPVSGTARYSLRRDRTAG